MTQRRINEDVRKLQAIAARVVEPGGIDHQEAWDEALGILDHKDLLAALARADLSADKELPISLEQWDAGDLHIEEVLARGSNVVIMKAAFHEAVKARPGRRLYLRHGARVIEKHDPK